MAFLEGPHVMAARQTPIVQAVDEKALREYTGLYQWRPDAFLYLQMWDEFSGFGKPQLVAFDESGDVRTLHPTGGNQFFAGPGAALSASIESRIAFQRNRAGQIVSLTWQPDGAAPRTAKRVEIEAREGYGKIQGYREAVDRMTGWLDSPGFQQLGGQHAPCESRRACPRAGRRRRVRSAQPVRARRGRTMAGRV